MPTIPSTDGVRLAVHELSGDPSMRPLLLCHATGFHARVWDEFAAAFPDRWCLAPDFRGFGDSTAPTDGVFDWRGFADDVLAVVDHHGLHDVQAVGHSKGGAALLVAELARPGTFDRLVCFEPIVFPAPGPDTPGPSVTGPNPMAETARRRRDRFPAYEEAIANYAAKPPMDRLHPDVLDDYVRHGFRPDGDEVVLKAAPEHEARTYEMGPRLGAFEQLRGVGCPVLVCGSGDGGPPAQLAPMIADSLPRGRFLAFDDLGHFGPLEDPVGVAAVVRGYLDDPSPDPDPR